MSMVFIAAPSRSQHIARSTQLLTLMPFMLAISVEVVMEAPSLSIIMIVFVITYLSRIASERKNQAQD